MELTRRSFVQGAAAAGALSVASVALADEAQDNEGLLLNREIADGKWAYEVAPEAIAESQIVETYDAEVVVVGAGTSGLCCALSAVESGAKVMLVSASRLPVSRGGSNHAIYSKIMEREGVEPYDLPKFYMRERLLAGNCVDQTKWIRLFNGSEEAMNWLIDRMEDNGVPMTLEAGCPTTVFGPDDPAFMPLAAHSAYSDSLIPGAGQPLIVAKLDELFEEAGGEAFYEMKGYQLVRGGEVNGKSGRVEALIAQNLQTGEYVRFNASKGIVLATGDFSADKDMMKRYCPDMLPLISDKAGQDYDAGAVNNGLFKGDGHKMGLWVGAAWQRTPNCPMVNVQQGTAANPYCGHMGLTLNRNGVRFSNEHALHSYTGRAVMAQPGQVSFPIWGTNYASDYGPWYNRGAFDHQPLTVDEVIADWDKKAESGRFIKADTLEELIDALGLPKEAALASIARYNELCEKGHDDDFLKRQDLMVPIKDAPFYGSKVGGRFLTVMGGLRTNTDLQVCEDDDTPIEGLYCVGTMVGDMFGNMYSFLMEGINYGGCCITFGYLLGKQLAAM